MADWMTGLVSGFNARKQEIEHQRYQEGLASREREAKVFEALINSPDEETRHLAIAGMLESTGPAKRKGGLAGWLGEVQTSPTMAQIRALSPTVSRQFEEPGPPMVGPTQNQGYIPQAPPATGSAAQAPTSAVGGPDSPQAAMATPEQPLPQTDLVTTVVGTPPPKDLGAIQPDVRAGGPPSIDRVMQTVNRQVPRQMFPTAESMALDQARARAQGAVEGQVAGLVAAGVSEPEARAAVLLRMRQQQRAAQPKTVAGEYFDDTTQKWVPSMLVFDPITSTFELPDGTPVQQARARTAASATAGMRGFGQWYVRAARDLGYDNPLDVPLEHRQEVEEHARNLQVQASNEVAGGRVTSIGEAKQNVPLTPAEAQAVNVPSGTTPAQIAGQQVPTQQEEDRRRSLVSAQAGLNALRPLLAILPKRGDLVGGMLPGAALNAKRFSRESRDKVAALESAVEALKGTISYGVQLNRGQSTEGDMKRAEAAIVDLSRNLGNIAGGDTQESALARIQTTEEALKRALALIPTTPTPNATAPPPAPGGRGTPSGTPRPTSAGPGGLTNGPDGKLYMNGQLLPGQ